jgi:hypothetical protein
MSIRATVAPMTATLDSFATAPPAPAAAFGHHLAPPGDPLEGAAFDAMFEAKIKPELMKCEAGRQRAIRMFYGALGLGALAMVAETLIARVATHGTTQFIDFRLYLATIAVAACLGYIPLAGVARAAKAGVLAALCEPLGVAYNITGTEAPAFQTFLALNLLPHPSEKTFEDFFRGQRDGIEFALCEATLHQGSGKQRHLVFSGQLLQLLTSRRFGAKTVVLRNTGWTKQFECPTGLRPVGLEDPKFNKAFAVFASDQIEAREILTPSFMQRLDDLEAAYAGSRIRCAFDESQLLVALEGPNRFEIGGMFSNLVERSRVEGIARNLEQVFKLIDQFKDA